MSRDSVRIILMLAALNDLDIEGAILRMHTSLHLAGKKYGLGVEWNLVTWKGNY